MCKTGFSTTPQPPPINSLLHVPRHFSLFCHCTACFFFVHFVVAICWETDGLVFLVYLLQFCVPFQFGIRHRMWKLICYRVLSIAFTYFALLGWTISDRQMHFVHEPEPLKRTRSHKIWRQNMDQFKDFYSQ